MKPIPLTLICLIVWILSLSSGCSLLVVKSGLDPEKVFSKEATASSIQKRLGKPIARHTTKPQIDIPNSESRDLLFLNVPDRSHDAPSTKREDYRYRGYVSDPIVETGFSMGLAMTFGLYEFIAFPHSIVHVTRLSRDVHIFSVWYDENDRFVAVRREAKQGK